MAGPGENSLLPSEITAERFRKELARYDAVAGEISSLKSAKSGQPTLKELDHYRYVEAPRAFGLNGKDIMGLDAVKKLVTWKLTHGKFRPALMKHITSNDPSTVQTTISSAIQSYRSSPGHDSAAALKSLTSIKGIGPATASLLLSVHDTHAIFFSDEVFWWLCCRGKKDLIKYNAKEYALLASEAGALARRLGVEAVDIEKVAYVLMRSGGLGDGGAKEEKGVISKEGSKDRGKDEDSKARVKVEGTKDGKGGKRKGGPSEVESLPAEGRAGDNTGRRYSKRLRGGT